MRLVVDHRAHADVVAVAEWYEERGGPELAARFVDAYRATLLDLLAMPRLGRAGFLRDPSLRDLRAWRIQGFDSHLVVYRVGQDLVVLRVLHGARDLDRLLREGPGDEVREPVGSFVRGNRRFLAGIGLPVPQR